eukprot:TRINITY_DN432_c0_g1_i1.p1 TRINITY_DN432_c0_g1~~TRINITY_DN432_c0_g1_i1.p1  ORF type:complete len:984 (-),score=10.13 TRINITY_DN432_c0_g1_i1:69-2885(-)
MNLCLCILLALFLSFWTSGQYLEQTAYWSFHSPYQESIYVSNDTIPARNLYNTDGQQTPLGLNFSGSGHLMQEDVGTTEEVLYYMWFFAKSPGYPTTLFRIFYSKTPRTGFVTLTLEPSMKLMVGTDHTPYLTSEDALPLNEWVFVAFGVRPREYAWIYYHFRSLANVMGHFVAPILINVPPIYLLMPRGMFLESFDGYVSAIGQYPYVEGTEVIMNLAFNCSASCSSCAGRDPLDCLSCAPSHQWLNYSVDNNTLKGSCECAAPCATCNTAACLSCVDNAFLNGTNCACNSGYYPDRTGCRPCHRSCKECSDGTSSGCLSCSSGFYSPVNSTRCEPCAYPCLTCSLNSTECTSCPKNFILSNKKCYCAPGYFTALENDKTVCRKCYLLASRCFGPNPWESLECNPQIKHIGELQGSTCDCKDGYYFDSTSGTCKECAKYCKTCNTTSTNCLSCINSTGIIKVNSTCLCNVDSGFYEAANRSSCIPCHPLAKRCTGPAFWESLECKNASQIAPLKNSTCACSEGYYYEPKSAHRTYLHMCQRCRRECLACNGTASNCTKKVIVEETPAVKTATVAASATTGGAVAAMTVVSGNPQMASMQMVEVAQMSLIFSDIKLRYDTPDMDGLYKGLGVFNLDFIPSLTELYDPYEEDEKIKGRLLEEADGTELSGTTIKKRLFLWNIGNVVTMYLFLLIVYPIIILLSWKVAFFMKIRGYFEWSGAFALVLFNSYQVLHAAFIQLKYFSHSLGIYYALNCYAAVLSMVFYAFFLGFMVVVLRRPEKELEAEEYKNKYGYFYNTHHLQGASKYTIVVETFRKFFTIALVVYFGGNAWKQCVSLLFGSGIILFWHLITFPKKSNFTQFSAIASEVCSMLTVFGFISLSNYIPEDSIKSRLTYVFATYIAGPVVVAVTTIAGQVTALVKKIRSCMGSSNTNSNDPQT